MITERGIVDGLREALQDKGAGYIYTPPDGYNCQYVIDGAPSCLIGHALTFAGVPVDWYDTLNTSMVTDVLAQLYAEDKLEEGVYGGRFMEILEALQDNQDTGGAWGNCMYIFEDQYALLKENKK